MTSKIKYHLKHFYLYFLVFQNIFATIAGIFTFFDIIVFKNYEDFYWGAEPMGFWWESKIHYTIGSLGTFILSLL